MQLESQPPKHENFSDFTCSASIDNGLHHDQVQSSGFNYAAIKSFYQLLS